MRIAVGCDHRGLNLKQSVIKAITESGSSYNDFGCYTAEPVDYPDIAQKVTHAVVNGGFDFGILICDTGIGMSIAANKVKGIRAALCHDVFGARRSRQHNDANILCLAAKSGDNSLYEILDSFLNSKFEGGRHLLRVNKIRAMEGS